MFSAEVVEVIASGIHFEAWGWIRWDDETGPHVVGARDHQEIDLENLDPVSTPC